jgi:hypothetical protein
MTIRTAACFYFSPPAIFKFLANRAETAFYTENCVKITAESTAVKAETTDDTAERQL